MNFQVMMWAFGVWGIRSDEKLVLIMLANNCAGPGCESSYVAKNLAVDCCMSEPQLMCSLSSLVRRGLIWINQEASGGDQFIIRYFINLTGLDKVSFGAVVAAAGGGL